jgi:hypothetical protein
MLQILCANVILNFAIYTIMKGNEIMKTNNVIYDQLYLVA